MKQQNKTDRVSRALLIREPWISMILDGKKDWEMRTTSTKLRGPIALVAAGSGKIMGVAELTEVRGPFNRLQMIFNQKHHRIDKRDIEYGTNEWNTAWVLKNAQRLEKPIPYNHPSGAVIWVKLEPETQTALEVALKKQKTVRQIKPRP